MHQIVDQLVDGVDRIAPEAGDVAERSPLRKLAFLADHVREALQLVGGVVILIGVRIATRRTSAGTQTSAAA